MFSGIAELPVLHVVVAPSFSRTWMIAVTQASVTRQKYELVLIEAQEQVWYRMMDELERQHGGSFELSDENLYRALANVSKLTHKTKLALPADLARSLGEAWRSALLTTRYVETDVMSLKADGVTYTFSAEGMTGHAHSPNPASFAGELVQLAELLRTYALTMAAERNRLAVELTKRAAALVARKRAGVPCVERYQSERER